MKKIILTSLAVCFLAAPGAQAASAFYQSKVLADGAVSYFQFEETSGTTAVNTVAGGPNGTYYASGISLGATSFSGLGRAPTFSGGNVEVPTGGGQFQFGSSTPYSLEMWFLEPSSGRGDLFTRKGAGGDFGIHSQSQANGTVSLYNSGFVGAAQPAANGRWHHYALTRDVGNNYVSYIDGVAYALGVNANTFNITAPLLIGSNTSSSGGNVPAIQFTGLIDEFAIYNTTLTPAQILSHIAAAPEPSRMLLLLLSCPLVLARRRHQG